MVIDFGLKIIVFESTIDCFYSNDSTNLPGKTVLISSCSCLRIWCSNETSKFTFVFDLFLDISV